MPRTVTSSNVLQKDIFQPERVLPLPGEALVEAIQSGEDAGRGVWFVPCSHDRYLAVPRLEVVPVIRGGRRLLISTGEAAFQRLLSERLAGTGRCELDLNLLDALDGRPQRELLSPQALGAVSATSVDESVFAGRRAMAEPSPTLRRLEASVLSDLAGLPDDEIATQLGLNGDGAARSARRDVAAGRELWRRIPGSWPWWAIDAPVRRDSGWWRDETITAAWEAWRAGAVASGSSSE